MARILFFYVGLLLAIFLVLVLIMQECQRGKEEAAKYKRRYSNLEQKRKSDLHQQKLRYERKLALAESAIDLPDTVVVQTEKIIYVPATTSPAKPLITLVGDKPDSVERKRAEKRNILIGIEKTENKLQMTFLTPKGIPEQNFYSPKLIAANWSMDSLGSVQVDSLSLKRANRRKAFRTAATITLGAATGYAIKTLIEFIRGKNEDEQ